MDVRHLKDAEEAALEGDEKKGKPDQAQALDSNTRPTITIQLGHNVQLLAL